MSGLKECKTKLLFIYSFTLEALSNTRFRVSVKKKKNPQFKYVLLFQVLPYSSRPLFCMSMQRIVVCFTGFKKERDRVVSTVSSLLFLPFTEIHWCFPPAPTPPTPILNAGMRMVQNFHLAIRLMISEIYSHRENSTCLISLAFLIHMSNMWIYIFSCVRLSGRLVGQLCPFICPSICLAWQKSLMLDITRKLFNPNLEYLWCL